MPVASLTLSCEWTPSYISNPSFFTDFSSPCSQLPAGQLLFDVSKTLKLNVIKIELIAQPLWRTTWQYLLKLNTHTLHGPQLHSWVPNSSVYICASKYTYRNSHGSTIHDNLKLEITQMPISSRTDKSVVVYSYDRIPHSILKMNGLQIYPTIWINLTNIILSQRSQTWKSTYCTLPFIWKSKICNTDLWC